MRRVLQATNACWRCPLCCCLDTTLLRISASHLVASSCRQRRCGASYPSLRTYSIDRSVTTKASLDTHIIESGNEFDAPSRGSLEGLTTSGHFEEDLQQIQLPKATNVRVKKAQFVKSSTNLEQCPKSRLPEFALIGRSNVGKSSLINMLTGQPSLAKVSKTPGKTIYINHFLINDSWYLVDLPGYGYAQRSKESRIEWNKFTKEYFLKRETLANVLLLVDASVPIQPADLECANWLAEAQVPFSLVFTKVDKRKKKCPTPAENIEAFQALFLKEFEQLPPVFETSSEKNIGITELLHHIAAIRQL